MAKATAKRQKLSHISYDRTGYTDADLKSIYRSILLPRMIEEKMLILLLEQISFLL